MTLITGREPAHWHRTDAHGQVRHAMTDPRTLSIRESQWPREEREYVDHLREHEENLRSLSPQEGDPQAVLAVLDWIGAQERLLGTLREMVVLARQELAGGTPAEKSAALTALAKAWPKGHSDSPDP